ncbi:hypothetical protein J1N35_018200 [Gossypium stocksii]|uniref:Uncharacterized protein n=1 Tax=Gossypium stocksii TaxID=47602 RepID=A0A9D3VQA4_9ROSI|nr:hypothetical protein J1N35_018200 [Gossypium stocksii]
MENALANLHIGDCKEEAWQINLDFIMIDPSTVLYLCDEFSIYENNFSKSLASIGWGFDNGGGREKLYKFWSEGGCVASTQKEEENSALAIKAGQRKQNSAKGARKAVFEE